MKTTVHKFGDKIVASIFSDEKIIIDAQTALEILISVGYEIGADRFAINKKAFSDKFFILSSFLAGEILQKLVNYHLKIAIYGDFSSYTSKPLKDFIYECNNGNDVFFTANEEDAIKILNKR